jgi:hypothetical protein
MYSWPNARDWMLAWHCRLPMDCNYDLVIGLDRAAR